MIAGRVSILAILILFSAIVSSIAWFYVSASNSCLVLSNSGFEKVVIGAPRECLLLIGLRNELYEAKEKHERISHQDFPMSTDRCKECSSSDRLNGQRGAVA